MELIYLKKSIKIINTGKHIFVVFKDNIQVFEYTTSILPYLSPDPEKQTPSRALQCHSYNSFNSHKEVKEAKQP